MNNTALNSASGSEGGPQDDDYDDDDVDVQGDSVSYSVSGTPYPTWTQLEQEHTERTCRMYLEASPEDFPADQREALFPHADINASNKDHLPQQQPFPDTERREEGNKKIRLLKERHALYLGDSLEQSLPRGLTALDASRPWLLYWMLHGLDLLEGLESRTPQDLQKLCQRGVDTMDKCLLQNLQQPVGGFAGGPQQMPHTAPTYAAVLSLCILGSHQKTLQVEPTAYQLLAKARPFIYTHALAIKEQNSGAFRVHPRGEIDTRSSYTILAVCSLLNMLTPELCENAGSYLLSCQTYEGGVGGEMSNEAHGGYTFCALAALCILREQHYLNQQSLTRWLVSKQMRLEGGFQGRTNKLVDGCYSWWQGASLVILESSLASKVPSNRLMNRKKLQQYLLRCCQQIEGGMRDKPGMRRDYYHTCYCLSGLSLAQHDAQGNVIGAEEFEGLPENLLPSTDMIYNIRPEHVKNAKQYFSSFSADHDGLYKASGRDKVSLSDTLMGTRESCAPIVVER